MSEDQPTRERIWSLREAREIVDLQVQIFPPLLAELMRLAGGKPGLINPILDRVADGISLDPEPPVTVDVFRRFAGAPDDPAQLEHWRKATYDEYQVAHHPPHTVRP